MNQQLIEDIGHSLPGRSGELGTTQVYTTGLRYQRLTFEELAEHGRRVAPETVHNGMAWSFSFNGMAVTHENDHCYLICAPQGTLRLRPGEAIVTLFQARVDPA